MSLILYKSNISPPVRTVQMACKALNIEVEEVEVNLLDRNYMKNEFIKINPERTIPTLVHNGNVIWDSHAIIAYLAILSGKEEEFYPTEPLKRARINQRLHFESCNIFGLFRLMAREIGYFGGKGVSDFNISESNESYERLNLFLEKTKWVAGDEITLADFSLIPSVTTMDVVVPIDPKYTNIHKWIERASKEWPYYNINQRGLDEFKVVFNSIRGQD
ncbi:glutathione S-transferase 1-1-like [Photinus pyralis]|uniref:glutathione S-transferase 1-1-like n=1 Tax=Photinus pyralis TaxID=7054 RepID=UPI0012676220|nr:glutathione S-transferase 1-1-like [Photinus pyralis]